MRTVVILGSAHPFRGGGITTFNERLAREFSQLGYKTTIYNFSLQYPGFLFPGKTQYSEDPAPADLTILPRLNSINPISWIKTGNELRQLKPDLVVVRYWLPFMAASLGMVLRITRKNKHTRIIAITDNVIPHEKRPGDALLTRYFLKPCDAFITLSENVMKDLRTFEPVKPAKHVLHPLYDSFGEPVNKTEARKCLGIPEDVRVILFFGFIRKYKGLDILLQAFKSAIEEQPGLNLRLLIAGEFYDDENTYQEIINREGLRDYLILKTEYIPQSEVKYYFCASDVVVQPYRNATQSGVTPLAYHFEKPMIVTNVGALADYVPHERSGLVTQPDVPSLAMAILRYFELGEQYFIPHLRKEKQQYSWKNLVNAILALGAGA
jgi:glycosyltransferase involved in cell wall biosynthesis